MSRSTHELRTTAAAAAASFTQLPLRPATQAALARMGMRQPTPIQASALPALLDGRDLIGQARTGSGKTLAFLIPAVELVDPHRRAVQVLVLTPTRELAVQIGGVLDQLAEGRGIATVLIFGGRAAGPQIGALRRGAQVVIGTPGRVLDLLTQGALSLDQVRFLVLDEADEMLDRGFAPDVERILARTPASRQTALFSATMPAWVNETAHKHLRDPLTVAVDARPEDAPAIEHVAYDLPTDDKFEALTQLLDRRGEGSIIVFGRTKHGVKKLARRLEQAGYPVGALQGNLSQNARDRVMEQFRAGEVRILAATNVAARGLDITSVELVINMELPESPELLTHRIGRTGRMGRQGRAITLLGPQDATKWRQLERGLARRISRLAWRGATAALSGDAASQAQPPVTRPEPRLPRPAPQRAERPEPVCHRRQEPLAAGPAAAPVRPAPRTRPEERPVMTMTWADGRPVVSTPARGAEREQTRDRQGGRARIVCTECGRPSEVPFQPDPTRPVYCRDCYRPRPRRRAS